MKQFRTKSLVWQFPLTYLCSCETINCKTLLLIVTTDISKVSLCLSGCLGLQGAGPPHAAGGRGCPHLLLARLLC
jgi:hypothetical protein